jgi:hypothetical protein
MGQRTSRWKVMIICGVLAIGLVVPDAATPNTPSQAQMPHTPAENSIPTLIQQLKSPDAEVRSSAARL